jgi:hypothetical protein
MAYYLIKQRNDITLPFLSNINHLIVFSMRQALTFKYCLDKLQAAYNHETKILRFPFTVIHNAYYLM